VVWLSRHRLTSPDSAMISEQAALETTVDFLVHGLLAGAGHGKTRTRRTKEETGARGLHAAQRLR
jgi:hypothetical protein